MELTNEQIRDVFLASGFTRIEDGMTDLNSCVYQAARALLAAAIPPVEPHEDEARADLLDELEDARLEMGEQNAPWDTAIGHAIDWIRGEREAEPVQPVEPVPSTQVREALAGLVALKDLEERATAINIGSPEGYRRYARLKDDHMKREPAAWRAARAAIASGEGTPSSSWHALGEPDPHDTHYDRERAALAMGYLTDDELANGAYMNYDARPPLHDLLAGKAISPIAWMTAVKDRIRWLSRSLEKALAAPQVPAVPAYTDAIGLAGQEYHARFQHAHPLPAMWRWQELWEAMSGAVAPAPAPAAPPAPPSKWPTQPLKEVQVTLGNGDSAMLKPERAYFDSWAMQELENRLKAAPAPGHCRHEAVHGECECAPEAKACCVSWVAAPAPSASDAPSLSERLQQKCSDWGTYWRAPDAHGVNLSHEQALDLLRDVLGVEVEIAASSPAPVPATSCAICKGNDMDMPCAYPSERFADCPRTKRLNAAAAADRYAAPAPSQEPAGWFEAPYGALTEDQIKQMADRLMVWKLPDNFSPDGGITFKQYHPNVWPVGTNLLTHEQACDMLRFISRAGQADKGGETK